MIRRTLAITISVLALTSALWAAPPSVRVKPANLQGSRPLEARTESAVIRDYLQSWKTLRSAMAQNRPALLAPDFVGNAQTMLAETIQNQAKLGLHTLYRDRSHDLQIVFYSPEGQSVQMIDNVEYEEQVRDQDKVLTTQQIHARYIVVLTPAETRWKVRILQADLQ